MEGHSAPVEWEVRTEDRDGQHQQQRQHVDGIDFRQTIPDKARVVGGGDAIPEHVGVVVGQDESAEDKEEGYADVGSIGKQTAAAWKLGRTDGAAGQRQVRCRMPSSKSASSQRPPSQLGSGGLAKAIGLSTKSRPMRTATHDQRIFIGRSLRVATVRMAPPPLRGASLETPRNEFG